MPEDEEHREWVRSWGDPRDDIYLTLDEINDGLELLEALKPSLRPNGELAAFLGWHPPSFFSYAAQHAAEAIDMPTMRAVEPVSYGATMWMDGVLAGMLIVLLMGND